MSYHFIEDDDPTPFQRMADLCIIAGEAVEVDGTERLREIYKVFLVELGMEIVRRSRNDPSSLLSHPNG